MAPRPRPLCEPVEAQLSPEAARGVRKGIGQAQRGEFADLSDDELRHYLETGELPGRVERWLDLYDSRSAT